MKFQDFNFIDTSVPLTIKLQNGIQVKKWIPISDKIDLVQIALQKSEEDGIYNEAKLDCYFHLNIIYLYTDIEFSEEDREDEMKLYDILEHNDIIDQVVAAIGEDEYTTLKDYLIKMKTDSLNYKNTAAAVLRGIIQDLPKNAAAAKEIMDSFDQEKYQNVRDFAIAANGGRNIITNQPVTQEGHALKPAAQKKVVQIKQAIKKD